MLQHSVKKIISGHLNYNDLRHTLGVVKQAQLISKKENLSKKESKILY